MASDDRGDSATGRLVVPGTHVDLLARPLVTTLATIRPDGAPQANVMWFDWDGEHARFSTTTSRQKYRNLAREPRVSFTVQDPGDPFRYLEVRGEAISVEPDPGGVFLRHLQHRYGMPAWVGDADLRVVVTIRPASFIAVTGGLPAKGRARQRPREA